MTKSELENAVRIAYDGRASEEIRYGKESITTGASSDIDQATRLLANAVTRIGSYSNESGLLNLGIMKEAGFSEGTKNAAEVIVRKSNDFYKETLALLKDNYDMVEALAERLLEVETMTGQEVEEVLKTARNA